MQTTPVFEVEIRFHFENVQQAYNAIPFLERSLTKQNDWITDTYSPDLFESDRLLRISEVIRNNETTYYLGYKTPDTGTFANIRQEIDEDITEGIDNSAILAILEGKTSHTTVPDITGELKRLAYPKFMSFNGKNHTGYDDTLKIHTKLMTCSQLKWPLIVELEKEAGNEFQARKREDDLRQLTNDLNLADRLVPEEPPTLLYQALFGEKIVTRFE